jgi:hypothetical protein
MPGLNPPGSAPTSLVLTSVGPLGGCDFSEVDVRGIYSLDLGEMEEEAVLLPWPHARVSFLRFSAGGGGGEEEGGDRGGDDGDDDGLEGAVRGLLEALREGVGRQLSPLPPRRSTEAGEGEHLVSHHDS